MDDAFYLFPSHALSFVEAGKPAHGRDDPLPGSLRRPDLFNKRPVIVLFTVRLLVVPPEIHAASTIRKSSSWGKGLFCTTFGFLENTGWFHQALAANSVKFGEKSGQTAEDGIEKVFLIPKSAIQCTIEYLT